MSKPLRAVSVSQPAILKPPLHDELATRTRETSNHGLTAPPLGLYVHIPWCERKCPYCDFNSHQVRGVAPEQTYVDALLKDLEHDLPLVGRRPVQTIFIGGGTPSLFSPAAMDRLLNGIRRLINLAADAEITVEANPGTVQYEKLLEYRTSGINRISIGVQSFDDDLLRRIGRIHGREQAIAAVEAAHRAGFNNINLDLMFALPGQDEASAGADVRTALTLAPSHLSYYQLTIEPNTWFHRHPPSLPDDDDAWEIQGRALEDIARAGMDQYEVSAFARPQFSCAHNLNYWRFGDYLGIGAGAHGKITDPGRQRIQRMWKVKHPTRYMEAATRDLAVAGQKVLTREETVWEFLLNALRLNAGFASELFVRRTGLSVQAMEPGLSRAVNRELLFLAEERIVPTTRGRLFLNNLLEMFLPTEQPGA